MLIANLQCHGRITRSRVFRRALRMTGWQFRGLQDSGEDWLVPTSGLGSPHLSMHSIGV